MSPPPNPPPSLRRSDLLPLTNLRPDGRRPHEIRRIRCAISTHPTSLSSGTAGSSTFEMGLTAITCIVRGPRPCRNRSEEDPRLGTIEAWVDLPAYAGLSGTALSGGIGCTSGSNPTAADRRAAEIAAQIRAAAEGCVLLDLYPRSTIEIACTVLSDGGGTAAACVNAASLALVDAGVAMRDVVVACTAGWGGGPATTDLKGPEDEQIMMERERADGGEPDEEVLVDLNAAEESPHGPESVPARTFACVLPTKGTVLACNTEGAGGNSGRIPLETFARVLDGAVGGCHEVYKVMVVSVRDGAATELAARGGNARVLLA